jgi:signal peptidase
MTAVLPVRRPGAADQLPPAGDIRIAAGRTLATARQLVGHLVPWLMRGTVGLAIVAFLGLAVGPHVFGYRTLTMLTGSMAPKINPGDVVVVTPLATAEVAKGMVVTYHIPIGDHSLITHRVISVQHDTQGNVTINTKGDANKAADPWTATLQGGTAYQVRGVVPAIGNLIRALRTPGVTDVLLYGAPALLAGWLLLSIWRPTREENQE